MMSMDHRYCEVIKTYYRSDKIADGQKLSSRETT